MSFEGAPPRSVSTPPPALRLADLVRELPGAVLLGGEGAGSAIVTGVHHDSRKVEPGDLFVARPGGRVDGAAFVAEAARRGAVAVLAAPGALRDSPLPVIEYADVPLGLALASSAVYGHPTFGLDVVGVTGTNGKTTTSRLVRAALAAHGHSVGLIGTLGHELGDDHWPASHTSPEADELMRLARAMQAKGASHLVMEVSSIALAARRMDGVRFRVAAFTNLTQDHLDYHGTMEAYAEAKARLFTELGPSAVVLHTGDAFGRALRPRIAQGVELVDYDARVESDAAVRPTRVSLGPAGIELAVRTPKGALELRSPLVGAHNVENLLCAVAIALVLEVPLEAIARGLSSDVSVPGRLERCDDPSLDDVTVLVDYAHTPDALARVLETVRPFTAGSVVCVFGCGGDRDPAKRPLMGEAAGRLADHCVLTNDNPRSEEPMAIARAVLPGLEAAGARYLVELDRRAAIDGAIRRAAPGDLVLIAGKGHETYQIVGDHTSDFDDRVEAREALARRRYIRAGKGIA